MPTLAELGSIQLRIYASDHKPPHFHVSTPDGEAVLLIKGLSVLKGRIRRIDLGVALQWATANRELLDNEWHRLNGS